MSWSPHYVGEPHSFAQLLDGALPFTPYEPNRGALNGGVIAETVELVFTGVLEALPEGEECYSESILAVWVNARRLVGESLSFPVGWVVMDVTATVGWPGSTVLALSPAEFVGLSVTVGFGGQSVRRVVALTEWRGVPGSPVIEF